MQLAAPVIQQHALKARSRRTWLTRRPRHRWPAELTGNRSLRLCWWLDIGSCRWGCNCLRRRLYWRRGPRSRRHTERRHRALLWRRCWGNLRSHRHCCSSWRHHWRRCRHNRRRSGRHDRRHHRGRCWWHNRRHNRGRGWGNLCGSGRDCRLPRWLCDSCRRHLWRSCGRHTSSGRLCGGCYHCCTLRLHRHWRNSARLRRLHWGNRLWLRLHRCWGNGNRLRRQDWSPSRCNRREDCGCIHRAGRHRRC